MFDGLMSRWISPRSPQTRAPRPPGGSPGPPRRRRAGRAVWTQLVEVAARDVLEDQVVPPLVDPAIVDRDDVAGARATRRSGPRGGTAGARSDSSPGSTGRTLSATSWPDLDVDGPIDRAHPPRAERLRRRDSSRSELGGLGLDRLDCRTSAIEFIASARSSIALDPEKLDRRQSPRQRHWPDSACLQCPSADRRTARSMILRQRTGFADGTGQATATTGSRRETRRQPDGTGRGPAGQRTAQAAGRRRRE